MAEATVALSAESPKPPMATLEQKRALVSLVNPLLEDARHDPSTFCEYVLRHTETNKHIQLSPMQEEWHELITANRRTLIWSHVESGKTQLLSVGRTLYELGRNPNLRCVIIQNTDGQSKKLLLQLNKYIEKSDALHEVFPNLRPADGYPWNAHMLYVHRDTEAPDPSIQCYGVHGAILGSRVDRLVFDDILSQANTSSPTEMDKLEAWIGSSDVSGRLTWNSKWWVVGNAWTPTDVYHRMAEKHGWCCARYPVMDERTGELYFPQEWPLSRIQEKKKELHPLEFSRQMLCVARDDSTSRFQKAWLDKAVEYGKKFTMIQKLQYVPAGMRIITGVDLATGRHKRKGDRTSIITIAVHPDEDRQILMIESGRWQGPEIVDRIVDTHNRYHSQIFVENNGSQEFILQFTRKSSALPVLPYTTSDKVFKDPDFGIDSMAVEFRNEKWIIPSQDGLDPEVEELMKDLMFYDPLNHAGDRLMSLFFAREGARITKRRGVIRPLDLTTR